LLRSGGVDLPVLPLLVLAGPGAPDLGGELVPAGAVRIAAFRDSDRWLPTLAGSSPTRLDLGTARVAADTLLAFQDKRRQYESTKIRPGSPTTDNDVPARPGGTLRPGRTERRRGSSLRLPPSLLTDARPAGRALPIAPLTPT